MPQPRGGSWRLAGGPAGWVWVFIVGGSLNCLAMCHANVKSVSSVIPLGAVDHIHCRSFRTRLTPRPDGPGTRIPQTDQTGRRPTQTCGRPTFIAWTRFQRIGEFRAFWPSTRGPCVTVQLAQTVIPGVLGLPRAPSQTEWPHGCRKPPQCPLRTEPGSERAA